MGRKRNGRMGKLLGHWTHGVVFGGGGARGGAHVGAWRVLNETGYQPDIAVGASIGALVAASLGMGLNPDEMEEVFRVGSPRLLDTSCNDGRGKTRTERLGCILHEFLGDVDLSDLNPRVAVTATDLGSQQRVLLTSSPAWKAVQASMSIPGMFDPVDWEGHCLVDGGVLDNVPTQAAYQLGAQCIVAVDIGGDQWDMDVALNTVACVNRQLHRVLNWAVKFSNREDTVDTWIRSAMLPASKLGQIFMAACPPDILITPRMQDMWLLSMDRIVETFHVGEAAAREKIDEVKRLMKTHRSVHKEIPKYLPALITL